MSRCSCEQSIRERTLPASHDDDVDEFSVRRGQDLKMTALRITHVDNHEEQGTKGTAQGKRI